MTTQYTASEQPWSHRIRQRLLRTFVGRRWRTFVGMDIDVFAESLEAACEAIGIEYEHTTQPPSATNRFGFGAYKEIHVYDLSLSNGSTATITLTPAYTDPVSRIVFQLFTTEDTINRMKETGVIDVRPINEATEPMLQALFEHIISNATRAPWNLSHHPRFTTSFLLDYKVRLLWKFWMSPR